MAKCLEGGESLLVADFMDGDETQRASVEILFTINKMGFEQDSVVFSA
jgi:hypothetical protein